MAETGKLAPRTNVREQQDTPLWEGIRQYSHFPDWLVAVRDTRRFANALSAAVPEFRAGGWQLKTCDVGHLRYKNGAWSALYQLIVRKPGETADTVIDLQGKVFPPGKLAGEPARVEGSLGAEDWHAILPAIDLELQAREGDTMLASLDFLTDPEKSRKYLEDTLRAHYKNIKIKSSAPDVVRYNRGSRCTVVYHLEYEAKPETDQKQSWPQLVVAKTYRGDKGKNAFESMSALWNSPLGSSPIVEIAEPLAYQPENRVLIQGPIREEKTLGSLLNATLRSRSPELIEEFDHAMRQTAEGLAALHHSGVRLGEVWSWKDQMEEVQREIDHLAVVLPELRAAAAPLLERFNQLAGQAPPDPLVPTHGTFRPPQVLLYQGAIGFIDFDSFRQSEPADDLALFLGEMFHIGLTPEEGEDRKTTRPLDKHTRQERFDFLLAAHDTFLEEYQRHLRDALHPEDAGHPAVSYRRVVLWEALNMFMFVLHDWTKIKLGDLDNTVDLLQRFLPATRIIGTQ